MAHNPEEYCSLRKEFIEAAVKYEDAGYRTFIQRTARSEEGYYESGRYDCVALIKWPYRPWRKCWILASLSGESEEPFSTMKTLFSQAWLWLPRVIADRVVDTAVYQLSPPADSGLYWARSHYQYWCWLLWFDWLWRCGEVETGEPEVEPAGMDLNPFSCSADLIARWGLDGSGGTIPVWLADPVIDHKGAPSDVGRPAGVTTEPPAPAANASEAGNGGKVWEDAADGNGVESENGSGAQVNVSPKMEVAIEKAIRALPRGATQQQVANEAECSERTVSRSKAWGRRWMIWLSADGADVDTDALLDMQDFVVGKLDILHPKTRTRVVRLMASDDTLTQLTAGLIQTAEALETEGKPLATLDAAHVQDVIRQAAEDVAGVRKKGGQPDNCRP